jgi:AraC-like DNA-binding protein
MISNKWTDFVSKKLFTSKDEFHELPYLSNSPTIKINSIIAISIADHNANLQSISTENPFCNGVLRYRNIEDGLWLLSTTISFKQNILAKAFYDSNQESDCYFLSFSVFEYDFPSINGSNQSKKLLSKCWTFYKPKTEVATYFYKETSGNFCNIVFSKKWSEKNIANYCGSNAAEVLKFLNLETGFLACLDIVPKMTVIANQIDSILKNDTAEKIDIKSLRMPIFTLISNFFEVAVTGNRIQNYKPLKNDDYANLAKAEKEILKNLSKSFVGVEQIAAAVNLSPTKLKTAFKMVFGLSMLQYHKQKNLQLAEQLVLNSEIPIKYIAAITGYESSSKFAAAFKKNFAILPSELRSF